jgi:hypothetical protein
MLLRMEAVYNTSIEALGDMEVDGKRTRCLVV